MTTTTNAKLFKIDRRSKRALSQQVTDGLRSAIFSGQWGPGEVLPPRRELAKRLRVGENTVRAAITALVGEGLIRPRPHLGCEVLRQRTKKLGGRVLHVIAAAEGSYPLAVFSCELRTTLNAAGLSYAVVNVPEPRQGVFYYKWLEAELSRGYDICIVEANADSAPGTVERLERAGVPYLLETLTPFPRERRKKCLGVLVSSETEALAEFVEDCRRASVKSVCRLSFGKKWDLDPVRSLESQGCYVEDVCALDYVGSRCETLSDFMRAGQCAMSARMARGPLPDLLFFTDDYMTMGALPVLLEHGVRVPEDVFVVSLSNRGFCPPFTKSLARIEYDPGKAARRVGEAVIDWFRTGRMPELDEIKRSYLRGETFPVVMGY